MTIKGGSGPAVEPYSAAHMQMRKQFGKAKFVVDISEVERKNPYSSFDALAVRKYPKKEYSLHKLPGSNFPRYQQELVSALEGEALRYINQTDGVAKTAIPSDWCNYCPHRGVCMESYLAGELIESGLTTGGGDRRRARAAEGRPMERTDRPMAAPALSEASDAVMRDAPAPFTMKGRQAADLNRRPPPETPRGPNPTLKRFLFPLRPAPPRRPRKTRRPKQARWKVCCAPFRRWLPKTARRSWA